MNDNWIRHILRRNCLLHNAFEGQMTDVKRLGRRRRIRRQLLNAFSNRRIHWQLKVETEDRERWKR